MYLVSVYSVLVFDLMSVYSIFVVSTNLSIFSVCSSSNVCICSLCSLYNICIFCIDSWSNLCIFSICSLSNVCPVHVYSRSFALPVYTFPGDCDLTSSSGPGRPGPWQCRPTPAAAAWLLTVVCHSHKPASSSALPSHSVSPPLCAVLSNKFQRWQRNVWQYKNYSFFNGTARSDCRVLNW